MHPIGMILCRSLTFASSLRPLNFAVVSFAGRLRCPNRCLQFYIGSLGVFQLESLIFSVCAVTQQTSRSCVADLIKSLN